MKNYLLTLIVISIVVFSACSKDKPNIDPTLQDSIEIDIDDDGIVDYNIKYYYVDIDPITITGGNFGLAGTISPNGLNEILRKKGSRSLFLRNIEDINEDVAAPLAWKNSFSRTLVSISTINNEGDWPQKWDIHSDTDHSSYFIGLKLVSDNKIQLAWVEIEINTLTGSVSIIDKGVL